MILGHGIDTVDKQRFEKLFSEKREKYLLRYFTSNELEHLEKGEDWVLRLATRFAAKEAIMKALQHGYGNGLGFTDIEIKIETSGAPTPVLHRKALKIALEKGIRNWWISFSHAGNVAVASVIACS